MAASTAYVLAAGGMVLADRMLTHKKIDVPVAVATGAAALVTAGIDKAIPGLGVSLGVLMVVAAALSSGVRVVEAIAKTGGGNTS